MKIIIILFLLFHSAKLYAQDQSTLTFEQITSAVEQKTFQIRFNIATTHNSFYVDPITPYENQNVTISADSSFIMIIDSIAVGYLPYFGSGYAFPQYGINGIVFKNKMINTQVSYNNRGKRPSISCSFDVYGLMDNYKIRLDITNDGTTYMLVISQQRGPISYIGNFKLLPPTRIDTSSK